jgi:hypothetical protein
MGTTKTPDKLETTVAKSIEERIRDLMAKATDPACSGPESEAAMQLAQKLMSKHDLTEADIKAKGADAFVEWTEKARMTKHGAVFHPVDRYLGHYIAKFVGCRRWNNRNDPASVTASYFGLSADIEFALHLRDAWKVHFDRAWDIYKSDNRRLRDMARARQSFSLAFAHGMKDRLEGWTAAQRGDAQEAGGTALVVQRSELVEAEMDRRGISLGTGKRATNLGADNAAAGAGLMAAKSAGVGRGVGKGPLAIAH